LLTSSANATPSFWKIELMCFSTARFVSTSDSAIAALLFPWGDLGQHVELTRGQRHER
jgi:hypothetical protein